MIYCFWARHWTTIFAFLYITENIYALSLVDWEFGIILKVNKTSLYFSKFSLETIEMIYIRPYALFPLLIQKTLVFGLNDM